MFLKSPVLSPLLSTAIAQATERLRVPEGPGDLQWGLILFNFIFEASVTFFNIQMIKILSHMDISDDMST